MRLKHGCNGLRSAVNGGPGGCRPAALRLEPLLYATRRQRHVPASAAASADQGSEATGLLASTRPRRKLCLSLRCLQGWHREVPGRQHVHQPRKRLRTRASPRTSPPQVEALFQPYGDVVSTRLVRASRLGASTKTFAFVKFGTVQVRAPRRRCAGSGSRACARSRAPRTSRSTCQAGSGAPGSVETSCPLCSRPQRPQPHS